MIHLRKVLIIADPGVDDAFAIMYALLHPEIEVVGIVAEYGNVSQDIALKNTAYLLQLAQEPDIPIIKGADKPLTGAPPEFFFDIHGAHGLGEIIPTIETPDHERFQKVYELIDTYGEDLTIINLSRFTSLALTYIQSESNIDKSGDIYVMGGAFFVPGNRTSVAEANVYGDPQAAKIVAAHGENVTFVPLNVSNRAVIPLDTIKKVAAENDTPFSKIIFPIMDYYSTQYESIIPGIDGAPLHDVTLISYLMNPEDYKVVERQVSVNAIGPSQGLTYADFRPAPEYIEDYPMHNIIIDFNRKAFIKDFVDIMTAK
ncbi:nucleoside hydrolase [Halobacillus aidingensis]|uniref:Purine nucleosidase n=1 Tax=Halobacillus aidingensis TaxID=240303 RepID=A0A1H0TF81_HALAD|nr:nucleoside hydrolase [Halobacillus aidingensis]SDP52722.1 purine nucleosidase [Halobacillus aidingensis]